MNDSEHLALIDVTAPLEGERCPTLDDYSAALAIIHAREANERTAADRVLWQATGPGSGLRYSLQRDAGQTPEGDWFDRVDANNRETFAEFKARREREIYAVGPARVSQ